MGLISKPNMPPTPEQQAFMAMNWDRSWGMIQNAIKSLDKSFQRQAQNKSDGIPQRHRRVRKLPKKLTVEKARYFDAIDAVRRNLNTIREGLLVGSITVKDAERVLEAERMSKIEPKESTS
jgi:hypothetical protein